MSTIYLLTEGSYSDYHIVAAYSTEEKAKAAIEWCGNTYLMIEEFNLDIPIPQDYRDVWVILIEKESGEIYELRREERSFEPIIFSQLDVLSETLRNTCPRFSIEPIYTPALYVRCRADNEEHAKKIATEKRQEFLAKKALENK